MNAETNPLDHEGRRIDFGRTAGDYATYRPGFPDRFFDVLEQKGWIVADQRALDLGTGTGSVALGLATAGLEVTGLDISPELLASASRAAHDAGISVAFVEASAEMTGQSDNAFDVVSAGQCWWWFDSDAAIAEAQRVLRPGGRLIICDFSYLPLPGNVAERTEDLVVVHNPGWTMSGGTRIHPEQVDALDRGGFSQVESFSYIVDVEFSHAAWRGRIRTCNGVGSALSDDAAARFDIDLAALLDAEFPGTLSIPHRIFATSGVNP